MIFTTRVHGIPCQCRITHYRTSEPAYLEGSPDNWTAPVDAEFEFDILDQRGRPAPWLEKYLNDDDTQRLYEEFRLEVKSEDYLEPCY